MGCLTNTRGLVRRKREKTRRHVTLPLYIEEVDCLNNSDILEIAICFSVVELVIQMRDGVEGVIMKRRASKTSAAWIVTGRMVRGFVWPSGI